MELKLNLADCNQKDFDAIDWDLVDTLCMNGRMIRPIFEGETPCPWDSGVSIEEENVVITGHMGPGGFGSCVCTLPKKNFHRLFNYYVEPTTPETREALIHIFKKASIK